MMVLKLAFKDWKAKVKLMNEAVQASASKKLNSSLRQSF